MFNCWNTVLITWGKVTNFEGFTGYLVKVYEFLFYKILITWVIWKVDSNKCRNKVKALGQVNINYLKK